MLRIKIKNAIDKSLVSKCKKAIVKESYSVYKATAVNKINIMQIYSKISKYFSSNYNIKDISIRELVAEQKISIEKDDHTEYIILSETLINENSRDYLSARAFFKKYRSDIIAIIALIVSIFALLKP